MYSGGGGGGHAVRSLDRSAAGLVGWLALQNSPADSSSSDDRSQPAQSAAAVQIRTMYHVLVPIMGFGLVYSVHKYGGCSRYYTFWASRWRLLETGIMLLNYAKLCS
jgi:hypothetical protein